MGHMAATTLAYVPESADCGPSLRYGHVYARCWCRMADGFARGRAVACGVDTNCLGISVFSSRAACRSFGRHLRSAETDTDDGSMDVFCSGSTRYSDGAAFNYSLGAAPLNTRFVDRRRARSADLASGPSRTGPATGVDAGHCSKRD